MIRKAILFLAVALVAGAAGVLTGQWLRGDPNTGEAGEGPAALIGKPRPPFTLGAADGRRVSAGDFEGQVLLVNLQDVGFVSSAGLRVLLAAAKRLSSPLRVCGLNETVQEVFDISGFTTIFDVYGDEQQGLAG